MSDYGVYARVRKLRSKINKCLFFKKKMAISQNLVRPQKVFFLTMLTERKETKVERWQRQTPSESRNIKEKIAKKIVEGKRKVRRNIEENSEERKPCISIPSLCIGVTSVVNFINVLRTAFAHVDPECAKKDSQVSSVVWCFWDLQA